MKIKIAEQRRSATHIFLLCWLVYAFAYFSRMNISIILPELQNVFGWSKAQVGLIGSGFFWIYGAGHLVNGLIGDKVSGRWFVFAGTILIAGANILFGFAASLVAMIIIWSLNGYFQSMIWSPMIRILTHWFDDQSQSRVSTGISTSMVGGYLLAWGLTGWFIKSWGWQAGVWIPGLVMLAFSLFWVTGIRDFPGTDERSAASTPVVHHKAGLTLGKLIKKTGLSYLMIANMSKGIVKEGITLWGPLYIMEKQGFGMDSSLWLILLVPIMNLFGFLLTGWMADRMQNREAVILSILFVASGFSCYGLLVFAHTSTLTCVLLLGLASSLLHGTNVLLSAAIPMKFKRYNRTSAVAGILDSSSYLGAGASAALSGLIIDAFGWNGVMTFWTLTLAAGVLSLIRYRLFERGQGQKRILARPGAAVEEKAK